MQASLKADYVIVGAGSAGCALAYRLSEAGKSVIVVEYGGSDAGPFIQMPAALSYPMNMSRYDWGYKSEPEPHLGGRRLACPRGKVIGGSSSINGMVYVRGHARDFDTWEEMGASGWAYSDVLPYYQRMENWDDAGHGGDAAWRGQAGPLHVKRGTMSNPLVPAFIEAGTQAGYKATSDYNGAQQEGFGAMEHTIYKGQRWSAANAYLKPALKSKNCMLVRAFAEKVEIKDKKAIGLHASRGNEKLFIAAEREVILAASSINTPKLLMLSGVGPAEHLKDKGIDVVLDRQGVGKNLQDHLELYIQVACKQPVSLAKYWNIASKARIGFQWLTRRTGLGASNQFESCAFIRSDKGVDYPDLQYHFLPIAIRYDGRMAAAGHGFQAHVGPMRSPSRGAVILRSAEPKEPPRILFNYMSHEKDWSDFRKAIRLTREIFDQPAFAPYYDYEIQPGSACQSDVELNEFIRAHVESAYHPCGTCKMGRETDPMAVVDCQNRVIGISALRVVDSSIFPQITNGNLNGPSIMVGEKASDHILERPVLARSNLQPQVSQEWQNHQR